MTNDNDSDEIIDVKLPRREYEILRKMVQREEVWTWIGNRLRGSAVWIIAGGVLTIILLWEKIHNYLVGN